MKCPRCQQENPSPANFCSGCGGPLAPAVVADPSYAQLQAENEALRRSLGEAIEQQTATSEILRAISEAQTDAQPVFDAIARSAAHLCEAARSAVWRAEGDLFRCVARCEVTPEGHVVSASPGDVPVLEADSLPGRVIRERQILQLNDVAENPAVPPKYREMARIGGYRSLMAVPMVREGLAVGVITVVRPSSTEFSDRQVELVKTFADQAVIAIENVRLFTELQQKNGALTEAHAQVTEALDQQTATSEILKVISTSPTEMRPVFETIVESVVRLCEAERAFIFRFDGTLLRAAASCNASPQLNEFLEQNPMPLGRHSAAARAGLQRRTVHIPDVQADPEYTWNVGQVEPLRTLLGVPMLKGDELLGVIVTQNVKSNRSPTSR